jgi:hypothetical protein
MIRLNLTNEPAWLDLAPGLRLRLAPCSSAVMMAARADAQVEDLADDASSETRALVFAKAIGRIAILDWQGVGDIDGNPVEPSPEGIAALLDLYPVFERFQLDYIAKGLALEQEKNVCAPAPNGTSAGATDIAPPAQTDVPNVPSA